MKTQIPFEGVGEFNEKYIPSKKSSLITAKGYWEINLNNGKAKWSEGVYKLFGKDKTVKVLINDFYDCAHLEDLTYVKKTLNSALKKGAPFYLEYRILTKKNDFKRIYLRASETIINLKGGKIAFGEAGEVLKQKSELETSKIDWKLYNTILNTISEPVMIIDAHLKCHAVNRAMSSLLGISASKILDKNFRDISLRKDMRGFIDKMDEALLTGRSEKFELIKKSSNKNKLQYASLLTLSRIEDYGGGAALLITGVDITEKKEKEKKLLDKQVELERFVDQRASELEIAYKKLKKESKDKSKAFEALRKSESQYRLIFNSSPIGILIYDKNGIVIDCNDSHLKILGADRETVIGFNMLKGVKDEKMLWHVKNSLDGYSSIFEGWYVTATGNKNTFMKSYFSPIIDDDGNVIAVVTLVEEATEKKLAEIKALKLSKMNSVISKINSAIVKTKDKKALFTCVCDILIELNGVKLVWIGEYNNNMRAIIPGFFAGQDNGLLSSIRFQLDENIGEHIIKSFISGEAVIISDVKNDETVISQFRSRFVSSSVFPLKTFHQSIGVINILSSEKLFADEEEKNLLNQVAEDICFALETYELEKRRKTAEKELFKLSQAVEQSPVSIVITDPVGNIEYVNQKFIDLSEYSLLELKGKNLRIIKSGLMPNEIYQSLWESITKGNQWSGELLNKKKSGTLYWEFTSISVLRDANCDIINFIAVKEDITERKRIENELIYSKQKAEELDELKNNLLSNMSHEFRTPLTGILGLSSILKNELSNKIHAEMAKGILISGKRLKNTLENVLELAQIESNLRLFKPALLKLDDLLNNLRTFYFDFANEKDISFSIDGEHAPKELFVDVKSIYFILNNLIDNAIKFTEKGGVEVNISYEEESNFDWLVLRIKDTGIGISKNDVNAIFNEFRQLSEGYSRDYEGAGIGLTLVKKIIESIGGRIEVDSRPGKGSVFTVKIPSDRSKDEAIGKKSSRTISLTSNGVPEVLYVEDNTVNFIVAERFLKGICKLQMAKNSKKAIELAEQKSFKLFLMDINLGVSMDGVQTMLEIKRLNNYKNAPFIALTGFALSEDRDKFLALGFDDYIGKPYSKEDIIALVKKYI